jgi:hypothetical protein
MLEVEKCGELFVGTDDESLPVAAMHVSNPDRSSLRNPKLKRSPNSNRLS